MNTPSPPQHTQQLRLMLCYCSEMLRLQGPAWHKLCSQTFRSFLRPQDLLLTITLGSPFPMMVAHFEVGFAVLLTFSFPSILIPFACPLILEASIMGFSRRLIIHNHKFKINTFLLFLPRFQLHPFLFLSVKKDLHFPS